MSIMSIGLFSEANTRMLGRRLRLWLTVENMSLKVRKQSVHGCELLNTPPSKSLR
jgi:hypothetical protein